LKTNWTTIGFIATAIIVLAFPLYVMKALYVDGFGSESNFSEPQFVGSKTCVECHKIEYDLWLQSDHYFAMDTASAESVLGDFNNVEFEQGGRTHKFYKKDDKFFVFTDGPDGKMQEFEVEYTFGAWPLQQYLVPFPGGKYQTLALTWDTIKKQWYHMADLVYTDQEIDHKNWLHWTNQAQNWNGMCADCHSTNLKKGFDLETKTFNTTWSEINVGCEACHGPASEHLEWAKLPFLARPSNTNTDLVVKTSDITNYRYVDLCARCHTRRSTLEDYDYNWHDLMDQMIPGLPQEPFYFADGQILEEDYVFGSFTQSKMYMNDVQCNDCHNVHSGKLVLQGNDLCLQCHRADTYDTYDHHFHKQFGEEGKAVVSEFGDVFEVGEGASCINCHMPGRYYMGVDYRRDHSFRIPRPDLSEELGTPNACNHCHADKSSQWASGYMDEWYGKNRKAHYGSVLAQANTNDTSGYLQTVEFFKNELFPPISRAVALTNLVNNYPEKSRAFVVNSFSDVESIIRYTAVESFQITSLEDINLLIPLLNDPVKAIRLEAAIKLSAIPGDQIPEKSQATLDKGLEEYREAMEYSADFAASRHNLGNYYNNLGQTQLAIDNFIEAIKIDDDFFPAKVNLAMTYNGLGQNDKAEIVLKDVVKKHPDQSGVKYSLGLLLAEMQKYDEAVGYLEMATEEMPDNVRAFYNLGQLQDFMGNETDAERALVTAQKLAPESAEYMITLIEFYIKQENFIAAKKLALQYKEKFPLDQTADQMLDYLNGQLN